MIAFARGIAPPPPPPPRRLCEPPCTQALPCEPCRAHAGLAPLVAPVPVPAPKRHAKKRQEGLTTGEVYAVLSQGPASTAELVERLGLSRSCVKSACQRLMLQGRVQAGRRGVIGRRWALVIQP